MRKSYSLLAALSLTTLPVLQAHAAWAPALPNGAGVIAEVDNQTRPLTFPRPDAFDSAGGILGSFNAQSVSRHGVLIKAYPVEIRVSRNARLEVRNLKNGSLITHPTTLKAGVTYKYQVSCGAAGWKLVVNGNSQTNSGKNHPVCVSKAWGKPVIGASTSDGQNALAGTIDMTWYTSDGSGASDTGDTGGGDGGGDSGSGGTTTPAGVAFVGDFETGDVSQWPAKGALDKLKYAVNASSNRRRGGRFAGRMEVRYMDRGLDSSGNPKKVRAEVFEKPVPMGTEWWYGWSTMIDPAWKDQNNTWYIVQQFHQGGKGSPPIYQRYAGGKLSIRCLAVICGDRNKVLWQANVGKDQWQDFVYQIRWSSKSDGIIRVWRNGTLIVDYKGKTAYDGRSAPYFKFGIYRGGIDQETQIIWHDEYRRGSSRKLVDPRNYR